MCVWLCLFREIYIWTFCWFQVILVTDILLTLPFALQKELFRFMRSNLSILDLKAWAIGVLFGNLSAVSMSSRVFPTFSSMWFSVSGFMLRSLMHLGLSFVQDDKYGSIFILLQIGNQIDQHDLLNMISFIHCKVLDLLSKVSITLWVYFWVFSLIQSHWSTCLFLYQYCAVFITIVLYYSLR